VCCHHCLQTDHCQHTTIVKSIMRDKCKKLTWMHIQEQTMRRFQGKEGRSWANKSWTSSFSTTQLSLSQSIMVLSKSKTTTTFAIALPPMPSICIDRELCSKVAFYRAGAPRYCRQLSKHYKDRARICRGVSVLRVELLMDTNSLEFRINTV